MEYYYLIVSFIFGITLGSFYNVVGYRVPKKQSLIYPSSHCTTCNHKLGASELVPFFSYLFQKGKCKHCGSKISLFYPIFELSTGILFALSYYIYGSSIDFLITISFISMLLIIIISDYQMMIIPDEVLISSSIIISILLFVKGGIPLLATSLINGIISFSLMFILKKMGDFIFKKESMGGGDIKLMFIFGMVLTYPIAVLSIFMGSLIGLPIALIIMHKKSDHVIPFGPFLAAGATLLLLMQVNVSTIINLYK